MADRDALIKWTHSVVKASVEEVLKPLLNLVR